MAWWNDILGALRNELDGSPESAAAEAEPRSVRQAQALLQRTQKDLQSARARAEAARRRMLRAQGELEELTRSEWQHPRYRDRLVELARAVALESELVGSFDAHITQLDAVQARIALQMRTLERDLSMARTATAASRTTQAVGDRPRPVARTRRDAGFERARPKAVMERLEQLPARHPRKPADED
ncbi:hypothetical protein [Tahibacter amnicola]|uniref:Phage shock protein A (PspA) family protein n=1 Tax=Tahibacter amnicola TaxID=2976241 RepID=A0ABY6BE05_9GAMM|nr:hypothetical protein [Tahibacter amnicola]UXI68273.1 hypothetical protein N4264_01095 [Tahibacter amnicola]